MAYTLHAMRVARENGHKPQFVAAARFRTYSVDKYVCPCGNAEVQIGSSLAIGCWHNDGASKRCRLAVNGQ